MRAIVLFLSLLFIPVLAIANEGSEAKEAAGPEYLEMTPKFTVNLTESKKYLMVNVQLLIDGAAVVETVKKHMPALRNELILLYSGRSIATLQTSEQREALRKETFETLKKALDKYGTSKGFEDVFFTEFLLA